MSRARSAVVWSLIGALALLLAGLLLILAYPKVVTRDFYEVTVASLEIDVEGRANILFHERVSSQTKVIEGYATCGKVLSYREVDFNGFLGRPKAGTAARGFPLLSLNELRRRSNIRRSIGSASSFRRGRRMSSGTVNGSSTSESSNPMAA